MSGKLLKQARADARKYSISGGFEEDILLQNPLGTLSLQLKGLHTKHWISYDSDGLQVNSKNAHVLLNEKDLIDNLYPYRNEKTENISLKNHLITVKDSSGIDKNYIIIENYPSETLGLIVCILGDYKKPLI